MSLFRARAQRMLVRFRHFGTRVARFFHGTPPTAPPAGLVEQEEEAAIVAAEGEEKVGIGGSIADHDKGHGEKLGGRGDEDRHVSQHMFSAQAFRNVSLTHDCSQSKVLTTMEKTRRSA